MSRAFIATVICVLILLGELRAERDSTSATQAPLSINPWRLGATCFVVGGAVTASQIQQSSMYWSDPAPFHVNIDDDWKYAHGADKFGHAFAASLLNIGLREPLLWSGVDTVTAVWISAAFAMAHQTAIEIRDGYSQGKNGEFAPYLGFSWGDMCANTIGASFPVLQYYIPSLKHFHYKYSLNPSEKLKRGGFYSNVMNDYESEYHWLSIDVYDLLPRAAQSYWTPFINIAIGHSVKDIVDAPNHYTYKGHHELWLSLDFNPNAIPGDAPWIHWLRTALNFYKLPAPCVRILPGVVWYGLRL